jgi:hypothetical protein
MAKAWLTRMLLHQPLHLSSVVTAAGEGAAHHLQEAQLVFAVLAVLIKLFWAHKSRHLQVFGAW